MFRSKLQSPAAIALFFAIASLQSARAADAGAATVNVGDVTAPQSPASAESAVTQDASNIANNPLQPSVSLNLNDYFAPSLYGARNRNANAGLIRPLIPAMVFGQPQLLRFTLPIETTPVAPHKNVTGLGDLTVFDLAIFENESKNDVWAIGPVLTAPTADKTALGAGKWQAGASVAAVRVRSWGLAGVLIIAQNSFAGSDKRAGVGSATIQPILFYNLPLGIYLRSTGVWSFDFHNSDYDIPVGAGIGKVWSLAPKLQLNTYIEPQYSILHHGVAPHFQFYAGFNFQYLLTLPGH